MKNSYQIDWGIFSLIEFIGANSKQIGEKFKSALDIGSGEGLHAEILKKAGLEVIQIDKYSEKAEIKEDFMDYQFQNKFDVIFCSHVIEHQRNVGHFLDKIYDLLSDDGLLLLSAPKHIPERLVEGHLNCFYTSYFFQQLIHAGFDLKKGKFLSCAGIENVAIVPKAKNFDITERYQSGYNWEIYHQERSPIELKVSEISNEIWAFENCEIISTKDGKKIDFVFPGNYSQHGIHIDAKKWGFQINL